MGKRGDLMQKRLFIPQESIPALLDGTKTQHRVVLKPQIISTLQKMAFKSF